MKKLLIISLLSFLFLLSSCDGDCKDEQIEKVEWITKYVTKTKDTLVEYSIIEDKREYVESNEEIRHTLTINNNNNLYANKFAVRINYGYYDSYDGKQTKTNEYESVSISPMSTHTFTFDSQGKYLNNYNSDYVILQEPLQISYIQRLDELKNEMIIVNSCNENIEALKEKYKTIRDLYNSKVAFSRNTNGQEK